MVSSRYRDNALMDNPGQTIAHILLIGEDMARDNSYNTLHSGPLPWCFVGAVMTKFGVEWGLKTFEDLVIYDDTDREDGFTITEDSSWVDLPLLTSTTFYEIHDRKRTAWFDIYTPDRSMRDIEQRHVAWFPPQIGSEALQIGSWLSRGCLSRQYEDAFPYSDGLFELNAIYMTTTRLRLVKTPPRAVVSIRCRVSPHDPTSLPHVGGGLRWPDPFWDWLAGLATTVGPHLLTGDTLGALTSGLMYAVNPI